MQFEKINAVVISLNHKKNHYYLNLFYEKGIINTFVYSSTLKKLKINLNNLLRANFEIKEENNLFQIIEINDEEFLLKDLNYEKLLVIDFWIKLIDFSFDTGESFKLLIDASNALNKVHNKQVELLDLQFKTRFLIIKDLLLLKDKCFKCSKTIEYNYYYDTYINSFYCKNCAKNKNYYINTGSFNYINFVTKKNMCSTLEIKLVDESKKLLNAMIKNKLNAIFNRALIK